jgi:hypothetical protein
VADAVAAQFANDVKAAAAHFPFDRAANFADGVAGTCDGQRLAESAFGATSEIGARRGWRCDLDSDGGVGVVTVFFRREIEFDKIAGLQDAITWNAVNDFVVDADADIARKTVNHWRGGARAVFGEYFGSDLGEFASGDAGTNNGGHGAQGLSDNATAGTKLVKFVRSGDGHELRFLLRAASTELGILFGGDSDPYGLG